jgi:hypothetical protein
MGKWENGSRRLEMGKRKPETGKGKRETGNWLMTIIISKK